MIYCVECGNPIQENGFPVSDKEDDLPIILFSDPVQYYHDTCFTMMVKEGKINITNSQKEKLFGNTS